MSQYKYIYTLNISISIEKFDTYESTVEFKNSDPALDYETKKSLVNKRLFDNLNEDIVKTIRSFSKGVDNIQCTFRFNDEKYVCDGQNTCIDSYLGLSSYMYKQAQDHMIFCVYELLNDSMDVILPSTYGIFTYLGDDILS